MTLWLLDCINEIRLSEVVGYYNSTRGVVSGGTLEYRRPIYVPNNNTIGSVVEVNPDKHKQDYKKT